MQKNIRTSMTFAVAAVALVTLGAESAMASAAPETMALPARVMTDTIVVPQAADLPISVSSSSEPANPIAQNQVVAPERAVTVPPAAAAIDAQSDINTALNQAGNEFMLAATIGTMAGGVLGLVGGCVVGAVVGAVGGCIPGMLLGAAIGPIIGGVVVGLPAGIAALAQAYDTLHTAGEISAALPAAF